MASRTLSRWILALVLLGLTIGIWWVRRRLQQFPFAYIGDPGAVLWSTTAQVRQQVFTLAYGQKVAVLRRAGDQAQVRSTEGIQGWIDARELMDASLWERGSE